MTEDLGMINVLELSRLYENQWVVLDRSQKVLDHGPQLDSLWSKYGPIAGKITFYFASAT
ncbi:MAG: hypothetical protein HY549_04330 [Elusimicrobia bacterium]|nr:hypothetical protein [Elusimicrobiota bacterium]